MQLPSNLETQTRSIWPFLIAFAAILLVTLILSDIVGRTGEQAYWTTATPISIRGFSVSNGEIRLNLLNHALGTLHVSAVIISNRSYPADATLYPNEEKEVILASPYDPLSQSPAPPIICPVGKDFSFTIGFAVDSPGEADKGSRQIEGKRELRGKCGKHGACVLPGAPCGSPYDCCSGSCNVGRDMIMRCQQPGYCAQNYDPCTGDSQCCSGKCDRYYLICKGAAMCTPEGEHCLVDNDCCSNICISFSCKSERSCIGAGSRCMWDSECCSGSCDEVPGLCRESKNCTADLGKCYLGSGCCSGNCIDGECWLSGSCGSVGKSCRADAECCSGRCMNYRCATWTSE
jgi:hypothetical protein